MNYTEQELFELNEMIVEEGTVVDRFSCTLFADINGQEQKIAKRKFHTKDLVGKGYIGFDAYNHNVSQEITDRIRITHIGRDEVTLFVRTPAKGNIPIMHKIKVGGKLIIDKDTGKGVIYRLVTVVK